MTPDPALIRTVEVRVTATRVGMGRIVPYDHHQGLQRQSLGPGLPPRLVVYAVPLYQVLVVGAGRYKAVRFALRNNGSSPEVRGCDTGLAHLRTCEPTWIPSYRPHSFFTPRLGAWRLIPHQGFLIHEGADSNLGRVGGSLGCVEIVDGGWVPFLEDIERLGGGTCAEISAARKLVVKIEPAIYPTAMRE
jgi:hypothetical protein